jgi:hypothetical protein
MWDIKQIYTSKHNITIEMQNTTKRSNINYMTIHSRVTQVVLTFIYFLKFVKIFIHTYVYRSP